MYMFVSSRGGFNMFSISEFQRWMANNLRADNTSIVTVMLDPPGPPRAQVNTSVFNISFTLYFLSSLIKFTFVLIHYDVTLYIVFISKLLASSSKPPILLLSQYLLQDVGRECGQELPVQLGHALSGELVL